MSLAAPKTDVHRTAIMLDLIHRRYEHHRRELPPSHVVLEEVAPATGWAGRYADVLALSVWRSNGLTLHGYEIKASRSDLKREIADPSKHMAMARYCDTWTLVIWNEEMIVPGVPETWGIMAVDESDGCHELRTVRKASKLSPEPWPRVFICSMVRNAYQQSPGAAYVARAVVDAHTKGIETGSAIRRSDLREIVKPLGVAMYGKDTWQWPTDDPEKIIADAVALIPTRETRVSGAIDKIITGDGRK